MLKFVYLKNQKIPVPVPVKNLEQALAWVSETFCGEKQVVTRVLLNGDDVNLDFQSDFAKVELDGSSDLTLQIDEASELSTQTLEAVKNFALVVLPRVKILAVELYQGPNEDTVEAFDEALTDLDFIFDLRHHINGILDQYHKALAPFEGMSYLAELVKKDLYSFRAKKQWSDAAVTLLGRLEPFLKELIKEIDVLQLQIGDDETILLTQAV